jgi:hypothetical protein
MYQGKMRGLAEGLGVKQRRVKGIILWHPPEMKVLKQLVQLLMKKEEKLLFIMIRVLQLRRWTRRIS